MLEDVSRPKNFRYKALRYFNVAGADPAGRTGHCSPQTTHLIKCICEVALEMVPEVEIFGADCPSADGTRVRDYVHFSDLVAAHLLALDALRSGHSSDIYNCGYGHGFSVREVILAMQEIVGRELGMKNSPRRIGDIRALIADSCRLKNDLGW